MRKFILLMVGTACAALTAGGDKSAGTLWTELKAARDKLPSAYQEFEASRIYKTASGPHGSKWQIVLDMSQGRWREQSLSGSGNRIRIFDGNDLFSMEEGADEFLRTRHRAKDPDPVPSPYLPNDADWAKATHVDQRPCGLPGYDHACVVLEVPLKPWNRGNSPHRMTRMVRGTARLVLDTENGLILALRTVETMETERSDYESDVSYVVKRVSYGAPAEAGLFKFSSEDLREVKELTRWSAAKIRKQFAGKPAPQWSATDIQGKPIALSAYKGKIVLLDFWTTWCPPCRADAPALDKLYRKYGDQHLMIIGVSVSEERSIVEQFLKAHPRSFPIVLTSENELPGAYQIAALPTYIVIDRDGTLASAAQGDQGFSELRKMLKKAGLEVE